MESRKGKKKRGRGRGLEEGVGSLQREIFLVQTKAATRRDAWHKERSVRIIPIAACDGEAR